MCRVIAIDITAARRANWREVIPEADEPCETCEPGRRALRRHLPARCPQPRYGSSTRRATSCARSICPASARSSGFPGKAARHRDLLPLHQLHHAGHHLPLRRRHGRERSLFRQPEVDFDPDAYVTHQVFYQSKDGTRVPMFISHKAGLALDGRHPTYLYGYGGFNISQTPAFSVSNLVWMEMGGVYALANLRGGGEYGKAWHEAGHAAQQAERLRRLHRRRRVADRRTATPARPELAIGGRSNGGLLVGACLTQRPDLFGACLPAVGVMDMLRFHKFTIGWAWVSDYGSPDDPEEFKALLAYSPYHNLKPGTPTRRR